MKIISQIQFLYAQYICTGTKVLYRKIYKRKLKFKGLQDRKYYSAEEGNKMIADVIREGKPCMICRYGSVELKGMTDTIAVQLAIRNKVRETTMIPLCNNAGFFPKDEKLIEKFGTKMQEWSKQVDYLAVWYSPMETYAIKHYSKSAILINPYSLEPYYYDSPWSKELKGKKVLVIHPFSESIEQQYKKRNQIFSNKNVLPDFELHTIKAIQSIGGKSDRFETWFDALEFMKDEIDATEFDIAVIGCGAYGFGLASYVKSIGKIAIHIGGATQLLFGIKGSRWTSHPEAYPRLKKMINDAWVTPSEDERPGSAGSVENGCYW